MSERVAHAREWQTYVNEGRDRVANLADEATLGLDAEDLDGFDDGATWERLAQLVRVACRRRLEFDDVGQER